MTFSDAAELAVKVIGLLGFSVLGALYYFQDNLLYFPKPPNMPVSPKSNPRFCRHPGEWNVLGRPVSDHNSNVPSIPYEEILLTTSDGAKISVWLMLQNNSNNVPTLIYFHGNAGNMGFRLENAASIFSLGVNVLMMDYRGYGDSTGVPNEKGINIDADTVLEYAISHPKLRGSSLVPFGRSLGGAVAISLAHRYSDNVKGIIVENTFLSIPDMVDVLMPWAAYIKHLVLRISWNSGELIKNLKHPILFISGDSDELVPPHQMRALYQNAGNSEYKDFYEVRRGTHNDTWVVGGDAYYDRIRSFFARLCPSLEDTKPSAHAHLSSHTHLPTMSKSFTVK